MKQARVESMLLPPRPNRLPAEAPGAIEGRSAAAGRDIAIRVQELTRGPLVRMARSKTGGPTFRGVVEAMSGILRAASESRQQGNGAKGDGVKADVLRNVSFEVEKGTIVALPGPDLRGVEALMRIMTASLQPTSGKIEIKGTIGGLVAVGDNLEADLTGREAAQRERSFLGVPEEAEEEYLAEVFAFSGLEDFEDVLVRRYSTGMSLRLGLALVFAARPANIILGDIMGVGDLDFRQRCRARIRELAEDGVTFLLGGPAFSVDALTHRTLHMERGQITADIGEGRPAARRDGVVAHDWHVANDRSDGLVVRLAGIFIRKRGTQSPGTEVRLRWRVRHGPCRFRPAIDLLVGNVVVFRSAVPDEIAVEEPGWFDTTVVIPDAFLAPIPYRIRVLCQSLFNNRQRQLRVGHAVDIVPIDPPAAGDGARPHMRANLTWEIAAIEDGDH